jgi:tRNA pseudouridine38-40 synthase
MRSLKLTLCYDGTNYAGWQVQANAPTIQAALELAWQKVTGETIRITASGRTDAGVHALGQVASLQTESPLENDVLRRALGANLREDIGVLAVEDAPDDFHAIRDALGKRYRYQIHNGETPDVLQRHLTWQVPVRLDVEAMRRAAAALVGRHDFSSFESAGAERATSVRTVTDLTVESGSHELRDRITIEIAADGFLYNMVRAIVGTLVEVGRGAQNESWPAAVLKQCDRCQAGPTAPPQGLLLVCVDYE